ncbi:MAG: NUDIX domain-containing protein, partial [Bacteroidota bacterium]|nr:NUDIX domain-containing protein [Bacteroidota bacterium]
ILTKQFRLPTYINGNPGGMLVETCAGLLEEGEEPQKAIIREIEEETGFAIANVQKIFEAYSSAGIITELIYYYLAEYRRNQRKDKGGGLEEEGEEIQVIELSFDAAFQMLDKGEIKDAKTIILLQYLKLKGI